MDESSPPDSLQLPIMQFDSSSAASSDTNHAPNLEPLNASEPESFEVPIMLDVASFREFPNPAGVPSPYELLRPDRFEPDPTHPNPFFAPPARTIDHDTMAESATSEDPIVADATSVRGFSHFTHATSPYELLQPDTFKPETIRRGSSSTAAMRTIKRDLTVEPKSVEVPIMPSVSSVRTSPNPKDVVSPDGLLCPDRFDPDPIHPNSPSAPPAKSMDHGTMTEPFLLPSIDQSDTPPMSAKLPGVVASNTVPLSPNSAGFYTDAATQYFKLADHHSGIATRHSDLAVDDSSISAHHSAAAAHHSNLRSRYSDLGIQYSDLMGHLSRLSTGPEALASPPLVSKSALASPTHISTLPADNNIPVSQHQPEVTQAALEPSQGASVEHEAAHRQPIPEGVVPYSPGGMNPARSGWNSLRYPLSQDLVDGSGTNRRLRRAVSLPRFS